MESNEKQIKIKEAIIKTIAFFDLFDYPLSVEELWKYLWLPDDVARVSLMDIIKALDGFNGPLEAHNGYYFFNGRKAIIGQRQASAVWMEKKFNIAFSATHWLKYLVGVKMVAVVNSVVLGSVKQDSDIDLFIVVASGRMWLTRLAVTLLVQLLGVRRHGKKISNRLCLSFYVTEDRLNLSEVRNQSDPYFYYWLATLTPLYDDGCYKKFINENNWIKGCLPNFSEAEINRKHQVMDNWFSKLIKALDGLWFYSFFGSTLERLARSPQRKKMAKNLSSLAGEPDSRVIISDTILKFHESDRREEFRRAWEEMFRLTLGKL